MSIVEAPPALPATATLPETAGVNLLQSTMAAKFATVLGLTAVGLLIGLPLLRFIGRGIRGLAGFVLGKNYNK